MITINNLNELEKYKKIIESINKTNYQQTYENIYCIHYSNNTAITFIENEMITTFVKKDENTYECSLNIEPVVANLYNKNDLISFITEIKNFLNKTLYFPLVYRDSSFYNLLSNKLYTYDRLYTSICDYKKINKDIINHIVSSNRVFFSNRNVKKFENNMYVKYYTKIDITNILIEIEKNSWKKDKKQDMTTKKEQLKYYSALVKLGIASLAVAYEKTTDNLVAYRLDALYKNKVAVLKNSYKEEFKKYSPGSYMLLYDLYKRYQRSEFVDLYGGPGLAKDMIETDRIERIDMLYGDINIIKEIEANRKKWDKLNYTNYLEGNSIKEVFKKKTNVLAVTSVFGLGPVGKLAAIIDASNNDFNWYAAGEEFDINIFSKNNFKDTCFTMDKEILKDFIDKYNIKYAVVVLKNKMARLLLELGIKVVYVDSLPFMWSKEDAKEGKVPYNVDVYCAQKTLELDKKSKEIFSKVNNLIWINPIINQKIGNLNEKCKYEDFVLINIGGLHSPNTDGLDYVNVVIKPIIEILNERNIIITTSTKSKKILEEHLKNYKNTVIETLTQEQFSTYIKKSNLFLTSPGLTTILESSYITDKVIFLPPQNISQFYNVEYGKQLFSRYKEITWNDEKLTLNGLSENLAQNEKNVIIEINNRIKEFNKKIKYNKYKVYIYDMLNSEYIINKDVTKIKYNGAEQVINELKRLINKGE